MKEKQEKKLIELTNIFKELNEEQKNYIKGVIDGMVHSNTQRKLA